MMRKGLLVTHFLRRVLRYGVVGAAISVVYTLSIVLLVEQFDIRNATLASVLAFIVVQPLAYLAHRHITFFDSARDSLEALRFAVTTTTSFLVTTGGMYLVTAIFARSYLFGIALNWLLIPAMNFLIYLIWVFRVAKPRLADTTSAGDGCPPLATWNSNDER